MNRQDRIALYERVEAVTQRPMLVLSVLFVVLLVVDLVSAPHSPARIYADWLIWVIWAAFAVELVVKTYLAPDRRRYLREHWIDVLIVLLPALRPLRLARALSLVRAAVLVPSAVRAFVALRSVLTSHGLHYALTLTLLVLTASAAAVTYFERRAGGAIDDFATALWWAITTATTVGYGDTYPVTPAGRLIAAVVMVVGVA